MKETKKKKRRKEEKKGGGGREEKPGRKQMSYLKAGVITLRGEECRCMTCVMGAPPATSRTNSG